MVTSIAPLRRPRAGERGHTAGWKGLCLASRLRELLSSPTAHIFVPSRGGSKAHGVVDGGQNAESGQWGWSQSRERSDGEGERREGEGGEHDGGQRGGRGTGGLSRWKADQHSGQQGARGLRTGGTAPQEAEGAEGLPLVGS